MALADTKTIYGSAGTAGGFSNEEKWIQVEYDFDNDGGEVSDLDVFTAGADLVVTDFYADVQTAILPAGTVNVDLGVDDGGTEFWSDMGGETLVLNALKGMDTAAPVKVAAASKVVMGIETAAITAGKIVYNFKVKRVI